jgi:hypothetical protein
VKVSLSQSDDSLPGLRIRIHQPSRGQPAEVILNHSQELEIAA